MNILIFGPPGAGKGTQSAKVSARYGMAHISTGDLFRAAVVNQTDLGKKAKAYLDSGQLVPDEIVLKMIEEVFGTLQGKDFILDGFPRTVPQAEGLDKLLNSRGLHLGKAVFLEVDEAELVDRLSGRRTCKKCGALYHVQLKPPLRDGVCDICGDVLLQRTDDQPEVIRNRLLTYEKNTAPLKEFYNKRGILARVQGVGSEQEVLNRIQGVMDGKLK